MKKGSSRLLIMPPSLAYGTEGSNNPSVPPGTSLIFEIDMVRVGFYNVKMKVKYLVWDIELVL